MKGSAGEFLHRDQEILFYVMKQQGDPVQVVGVSDALDLPQSTVSRDLTGLAADGFLYREKQGKKVLYYPEDEVFEDLRDAYEEFKDAYESALELVDLPEDESTTSGQAEGDRTGR